MLPKCWQGAAKSLSGSRAGLLNLLLSVLILITCPAMSRPGAAATDDFTHMSLEELMEVEVTSVAKRSQELGDAAAAVTVITSEDIRRSTATSIPELLRMVPGVHVARLNASEWAISIRGFNDRFANKLLVLMDGRTLYTPVWSGVLWANQDMVLEDIDRIEVIRGPGASLWGANAVNGVINIITKKAAETQGALASLTLGTEARTAALRYGGAIADKGAYRVYAKGRDYDESVDTKGDDIPDDWQMSQGGFRVDWEPDGRNTWTLQGDIYEQDLNIEEAFQSLRPPYSVMERRNMDYTGGNALFRWTRKNPAGNGWIFQAYYNRTATTDMITLDWEEDIYDLDFQHSFTLGERQLCTWGLAYRYYRIHMKPDETSKYSFDPEKTGTNVTSAFVQDEIDLIRDKLLLTLGSKFEYHETTHLEVQPTGRLLWRADKQNTLWTAVSRAVRTPSRGELDAIIDTVVPPQRSGTGTPLIFQIVGNDDVESGEVLAFELGYRTMINDALSLDMTGFYNRYENLLSAEQPTGLDGFETEPVPHAVAKSYVGNDVNADTYGIELSANWRPADTWRLRGTYTYTEIQLEKETDQPLIYGGDVEGKSPEQMVSLRSLWEPVENVEIDARLRFVDRLEALEIPSYFEGDLRLAYKPRSGLEISLAGRNLLDSSHPEFAQLNFLGKETAEVERSVYGRITWRF